MFKHSQGTAESALKIGMKVTRGMMRAGKKHFHLESFQSGCCLKELTSVKKQSVSQTVSEPAEPFSGNHMDEISVLAGDSQPAGELRSLWSRTAMCEE